MNTLSMKILTTLIGLFWLASTQMITAQDIKIRDVLDLFIGDWEGRYTVKTTQGELIKTMRVRQSYWWQGDVQKGVSVFQEGERIIYAESSITFDKGELLSEVQYGNSDPEKFFGRIVGVNSVSWLPTNFFDARYKQQRESVIQKNGSTYLVSEGIDLVKFQGADTRIVISGELKKVEKDSSAE